MGSVVVSGFEDWFEDFASWLESRLSSSLVAFLCVDLVLIEKKDILTERPLCLLHLHHTGRIVDFDYRHIFTLLVALRRFTALAREASDEYPLIPSTQVPGDQWYSCLALPRLPSRRARLTDALFLFTERRPPLFMKPPTKVVEYQ